MGRIEAALGRLGSLDELAARDTPAARLDARAKVAVTLAFVGVVASFGRLELGRLAPLAAFPLAFAALGDVPWRPLLVRLALASPLALGVAAFEPFLDRAPALALGPVTVSRGELALLVILAKFALSLGAALLLVATTGFDAICLALARLGVPRVLVAQLSLTYRYLFVLGEEAARLVRAHGLRAPGARRPTLRTAGTLLGQLLLRAMARAERIHSAMLARGFDGRLPMGRRWRFRRADLLFVCAALLILAAARALDVPGLVGASLSGALR
jgi:cobalt/nickel transport system permease protein